MMFSSWCRYSDHIKLCALRPLSVSAPRVAQCSLSRHWAHPVLSQHRLGSAEIKCGFYLYEKLETSLQAASFLVVPIHTSTFAFNIHDDTIKELDIVSGTCASVSYLPVFACIFSFHFTSLLLFASQSVSECSQQGMRGAVVEGGGGEEGAGDQTSDTGTGS